MRFEDANKLSASDTPWSFATQKRPTGSSASTLRGMTEEHTKRGMANLMQSLRNGQPVRVGENRRAHVSRSTTTILAMHQLRLHSSVRPMEGSLRPRAFERCRRNREITFNPSFSLADTLAKLATLPLEATPLATI
jgi:hypothetical protein